MSPAADRARLPVGRAPAVKSNGAPAPLTKAATKASPAATSAKPNGSAKLIPDEVLDHKHQGVKGVFFRFRPQSSPPPIPKEILDIVRMVKDIHPKTDTRGLVRAYEIAHLVHEGQLRKSGEPFIEHPIGVARILAEQGMDATTIIAAFLHDSVEDTSLELQELRTIFGDEVADIIDGLTKIDRIKFRSKEQERAENLRKMIVAMAKDMRVLIIKLADRLHNMRTIAPLAPDRREIMATETLEIYSPLANRLGMSEVKAELEDLAFKTLQPKVYDEIENLVSKRAPARGEYIEIVIRLVEDKMRDVRIKSDITGRPKTYYSIYDKMTHRGREFDEIFDLVGIRVLVDDLKDCYGAVGAIHSLWKPVPGRFKDYIAMPKFNLYQSLHTTVVGPHGKPLEIQIRTHAMHRTAEKGVAAHWAYKEAAGSSGRRADSQAAWMQRMLELQDTEDDVEFLDTLRLDLFADEVFVFTPKGEVIELPKGAISIDFAYAIHTEVGHYCTGARVDGRLQPLSHQLVSGETVEVLTSKTGGPSRDWLDIVATPRARTKIKQWFTVQRREEALAEGKDYLTKSLRKASLPVQKMVADGSLEALALDMKYPNIDQLYVAVGEGRTSANSVVRRYLKLHQNVEPAAEMVPPPPVKLRAKPTSSVLVEGSGDIWTNLARCCMPVPLDPIVGFVTRGRGVSVHRSDCPNALTLAESNPRMVPVKWNPRVSGSFAVEIQIESLDRPGLLRDVTAAVSDTGTNILNASMAVSAGHAIIKFTFEITAPPQLLTIVNMVNRVDGVYEARRVTPKAVTG